MPNNEITKIPDNKPLTLPNVSEVTGPMLSALTTALGVDRSILAADDQIEHAWANLPRLLKHVPPEKRSETLVRMCVAVGTGLFDSGVNYAWNAAIIELRQKVRVFGLSVIPQITGRNFDESTLLDLKDSDLLLLCLKLNLISEDGYFLLDQCRDIRNNFSAAHPSVGMLDETEFLSFFNRVAKHALVNERNLRGVDIHAFIVAIKGSRFSDAQLETWRARIAETFDAQRELLFSTLHGIYCDPASGEEARVNALVVCRATLSFMTPKAKSGLVDRHQDYRATGDDPRFKASQQFFVNLELISLLGDTEIHSLITSAAKNLIAVHNSFNNFYNEPPFAERLAALVAKNRVPESARQEFVEAVTTCAVGNQYGVCNSAMPVYISMIRSFSPAEIWTMLSLPDPKTIVGNRIKSYPRCQAQFKMLIQQLDPTSVPTQVQSYYENWLK